MVVGSLLVLLSHSMVSASTTSFIVLSHSPFVVLARTSPPYPSTRSTHESLTPFNFLNYFSCSESVIKIVTNVPQGSLSQSKMICIKDLVESPLFRLPECRSSLLPVFCQQIVDRLNTKEEVCSTPFACLLVALLVVVAVVVVEMNKIIQKCRVT